MLKKVSGALICAAAILTAGPAVAVGPGIYSHTIRRTHSQGVCIQRAAAIAASRQYITEGDGSGMWMTSRNGNMSFAFRCDIPGITLVITSGPTDQLRARTQDILMDYSTIQIGG